MGGIRRGFPGVASPVMRVIAVAACVAVRAGVDPAAVAGQVPGGPAAGPVPAGSADVVITVSGAGAARVVARYVVAQVPASAGFRAMPGRCVRILDATVERDGAVAPLDVAADGPWVELRGLPSPLEADTVQSPLGSPGPTTVRYEVRWSGASARVPVPVLSTPVPQEDGEREGTVRTRVRFPDPDGRVVFPHMRRDAPTEWSARTVAVPSFVEVEMGEASVGEGGAIPGSAGAAACPPDTASTAAPDGGLVWRFWLLVGIMATWVPLYLAWARRGGGGSA